jgi:hypothetical protein
MMETWREIEGYEGLYSVSDMGRVKTPARYVKTWFGQRLRKERLMTLKVKSHGYLEVALQKPGAPIRFALVHRLVAEAFIGVPLEGQECRHRDGNRLDCRVNNLLWGTCKQNIADQYRHGTRIASEWHPLASLTTEMVQWIRESDQSGAEIARQLGLSVSTVCRARKAQTYAAATRGDLPGLLA